MTAQLKTQTARRERILICIAAAFLSVGAVSLQLAYAPFGVQRMLLLLGVWTGCFGLVHIIACLRLPTRDPYLLPVAALLSGWGLLLVGRLAPSFFYRQTMWLVVSTVSLLAASLAGSDLRWLRRFRYTWLLAGLALLAATFVLGVNPSGAGPRLWLRLGSVYLQPSEPLKLLMTVYLASYLAERRRLLLADGRTLGGLTLPPLAYVGPLAAMFGLTLLLLAWQQDLGAAMLFFFTFLTLLYLATGQRGYVAAGLVLFLIAGVVGYSLSARVAVRVDGWVDPWPEAADRAFQIVQSLLALGAGGIFGQGPGLGRPTYIPAVHTDFVFAAIAEEFGLVGAVAVIGLFAVLLLRGMRIAGRTRRPFAKLLAAGLTAGLVIQAWVIVAGNVKVAPIAGVTLPFLSYGGSSLVSTFVALGLLTRISSAEPGPRESTPIAARSPLLRTTLALGLGLAILAVVSGYWAVARAEWLVERDDNPRRVEYEQRIVRGRILDRQGLPLADVEVLPSGVVRRTYPRPQAAPVVGYASLRYGTGGVEDAWDATLRGETGRSALAEAWGGLLHRPPQGQDVGLAIDTHLQELAQSSLAGHSGALVLLDIDSGEVLVMASAPTFNPAELDEEWETLSQDEDAPLVNRAIQGLYQPGAALQTVVLAEAVARGELDLDSLAPQLDVVVDVGGVEVECLAEPASEASLAQAYQDACPGPIAWVGKEIGIEGLFVAVQGWGLTDPPPFDLPTESGDWSPVDPTLEAIGQGSLTVSPLQMALVAATVASEGRMPVPWLVLQVEDAGGEWRSLDRPVASRRVIQSDVALVLLQSWRTFGPGVVGHLGTAVAGEEQPPHAWFLGAGPADSPRFAAAVLLEHPDDPNVAAALGTEVLRAAMAR